MSKPTAAKEKEVGRDKVEQFFVAATKKTTSDETRKMLKATSSGRPGKAIVQMQKQIWEELGVSVEDGRAAVGRIEERFPGDAKLVELRDQFAKSVDDTYLQALEDRRPATLEKKSKMKRNTVLEFLDACGVKMDQPDIRERLRKEIEETGAMPDTAVNEVHGETMEMLGFDRDHGQKCFSTFGDSKEFAKDRDVAVAFARWRGKTSEVCLQLLRDFQKGGGELKVEAEVKGKLQEMDAKEALNAMTFEERSQVLERNAKKVNVFRGLPHEIRERHLEKLSPEERMELIQCEVMMVTIMQHRQQQAAHAE